MRLKKYFNYKLKSTTGYRVYRLFLATQPCTLALTTGYRVYRLVLATQPCTLALTTGYKVYRPVPATQSCTLASTLVTEWWSIVNKFSLRPARGQPSHECQLLCTLQYADPWAKSLLNVKSCLSLTGPDHSKNSETVFLGSLSPDRTSVRRDRKFWSGCQMSQGGTHLPVGSRLNAYWKLAKL